MDVRLHQVPGHLPGLPWPQAGSVTHRFRWRQTKYGPLNDELTARFGHACRIFARGHNGTLGIEFEDGYRAAVMKYAVAPL